MRSDTPTAPATTLQARHVRRSAAAVSPAPDSCPPALRRTQFAWSTRPVAGPPGSGRLRTIRSPGSPGELRAGTAGATGSPRTVAAVVPNFAWGPRRAAGPSRSQPGGSLRPPGYLRQRRTVGPIALAVAGGIPSALPVRRVAGGATAGLRTGLVVVPNAAWGPTRAWGLPRLELGGSLRPQRDPRESGGDGGALLMKLHGLCARADVRACLWADVCQMAETPCIKGRAAGRTEGGRSRHVDAAGDCR